MNEAAAEQGGFPAENQVLLTTTSGGSEVAFTVTAVIADGSTDPKAYGSLGAYASLLGTASIGPVAVRVTGDRLSQSGAAQLVDDALTDLDLPLSASLMRTDTTWRVATQIDTLSAVFAAFAIVMLTVAAAGLLNVGLSSVNERARELVIRRAIGVGRLDVFLLVMGSALAVAAIVAVLATGTAGALVYGVVPFLLPAGSVISAPEFPWAACLIGCAAAAATLIAGAAVPAIKAARLPVAQALRE